MNLSPDDPRLTAYALGELPADEVREVERAVADSPELRAAVEEIRQMADLLKGELADEPAASLSGEEKEVLLANASPTNV
ncbi:MAG: anti-sigma factor family protein, partial [Limisphaerales bacterium]